MNPYEDLGNLWDIPVNRLFDWKLTDRSPHHAEMHLTLRPEYAQGEGVVHGGIITALADTAAVYALLPQLPPERGMTSIELKINFLRPVHPEAGELVARSQVVQFGQRVAVCEVDVYQNDKRAAKGLFTYLFFDRASSADGAQAS